MSRNFIWAAVFAAALITGPATNAIADNSAIPAQPAQAAPPAAPPNAPAPAQPVLTRVLGRITAIDTKAKTITLSGFGGNDQTIAYNDDTKYMLDIPAQVSDIKVGDTLRAITFGDNANNSTATSITPNFLNIVPPVDVNGPPFPGPITPVEGVVTSLSPLTVATPDKKTITITIGGNTVVSKSKDATAADVKTDTFGSGIVKGQGDGQVLTELHIIQMPSNNN